MKNPPPSWRRRLCGLGLAAALPLFAGEPAAPARGLVAAPVISPDIAPDHHVTFRLRAPNARSVTLTGPFTPRPLPLTKDAAGLWTVTVGPLEPEIYDYSFNVDGVVMIDPANPAIKPMRNPRASILEIPGEPPLLHDFQNVPHGTVNLQWYNSTALGRRRPMQVYTPPGYQRDPAARFPILYLFHGSGDNEATWVADGHAHWILDNLIAQGRARPMIVVMLDGHAVVPGKAGASDGASGRSPYVTGLERDVLDDVLPFVRANYRVADGPANSAIIGLSMGGNQSLQIGLRHPDQFAWVGGMSTAVPENEITATDTAALNRQLKLLWIACGRDDAVFARATALHELLESRGVRHQFVPTEGTHSWPVWRKHLAVFAPLLFQPAASR
jgi:enterochelin esterase-like enzyme